MRLTFNQQFVNYLQIFNLTNFNNYKNDFMIKMIRILIYQILTINVVATILIIFWLKFSYKVPMYVKIISMVYYF